jgi:hypothetical protein
MVWKEFPPGERRSPGKHRVSGGKTTRPPETESPSARVRRWNHDHDIAILVTWRTPRGVVGTGFTLGPAILEAGSFAAVPVAGRVVPVPLEWIYVTDGEALED